MRKRSVKKKLIELLGCIVLTSLLIGVASADGVTVSADVHPGTISLDEVAHVSVGIKTTYSATAFPVDVVLVIDCSGSMERYGTIIFGPEEVNLTTSYKKIGEFSLSEESDVEIMLQIPVDIYRSRDIFFAYLKKKGRSWQSSRKSGYSTVGWNDIQPGTYEVYAKLYYSNGERGRIFAVELPPERIESAKDAACAFVDMLGDDDRAGVVKFHSRGWSYEPYCKLVQPLESNKNAVKNVIRNTLRASGGTPMGEGLDRALDHLESHHARENAVKAIIMLTDGWWNMGCNPIEQAHRAKGDGIPIYTIGWGGVNESALREIADISGGKFYKAATGDDLRDIYEEIAIEISNIGAKNATLNIELSRYVEYAGNANPEPEVYGRNLTWNLGTLYANDTTYISFDVRPEVKGFIPINTNSSVLTYFSYEYDHDELKEEEVPVVHVNVVSSARPVAILTANPDSGDVGEPIFFDASQSYDPDGYIVRYIWNFDSFSGAIAAFNYSFNESGAYQVNLTVVDNDGLDNSTTVTVNINESHHGRVSRNLTVLNMSISADKERIKIGQPVSISGNVTLNNTVNTNVSIEIHINGEEIANRSENIGGGRVTINISATWVPMTSGKHRISLHVYEHAKQEKLWIPPVNDPVIEREVLIERIS